MVTLRYIAGRAKDKILQRRHYYIDGLTLESSLKRVAPSIHDTYLSQVRGAAGSLTGAIISTVQSVILPHFVVPAVFNVVFLGHYSLRIKTMRDWAKANKKQLARRREIIVNILYGIIIKLCVSALTLGHADFALVADALAHVANGFGNAKKLIALLDQVQEHWANSEVVSDMNVGFGASLGAAQNSIGFGGKTLTWGENLSSSQIAEMGFANEAGDITAQVALEQPADKAVGLVQRAASRPPGSRHEERYAHMGSEAYTPAESSTQQPYSSVDDDETEVVSIPGFVPLDHNQRPTWLGTPAHVSGRRPLTKKRREAEVVSKKTSMVQASVLGAVATAVIGGLWYFLG